MNVSTAMRLLAKHGEGVLPSWHWVQQVGPPGLRVLPLLMQIVGQFELGTYCPLAPQPAKGRRGEEYTTNSPVGAWLRHRGVGLREDYHCYCQVYRRQDRVAPLPQGVVRARVVAQFASATRSALTDESPEHTLPGGARATMASSRPVRTPRRYWHHVPRWRSRRAGWFAPPTARPTCYRTHQVVSPTRRVIPLNNKEGGYGISLEAVVPVAVDGVSEARQLPHRSVERPPGATLSRGLELAIVGWLAGWIVGTPEEDTKTHRYDGAAG